MSRNPDSPYERLLRNELLSRSESVHVNRASGCLDVMGGFAEDSGALVLGLPIGVECVCAVQRREDRELVIDSSARGRDRSTRVRVPLAGFYEDGRLIDYSKARDLVADRRDRWALHVVGGVLALMKEQGLELTQGLTICIASDIPEGIGLASSAALQIASLGAVAAAMRFDVVPQDLASLCHFVENAVVGAPSSIVGHVTAACGAGHKLFALQCQPCDLEGFLPVADGLRFFAIDSGVQPEGAWSAYCRARTAAFMGYRILADARGCRATVENGHATILDPEWGGYLARCSRTELESWRSVLPDTMRGSDFLTRYGATSDLGFAIGADVDYPVRLTTEHAICENDRASAFRDMMLSPPDVATLRQLGDLMFESHESSSECGLGSDAAEDIVARVRAARASGNALYGARITARGCGSAVAVLGREAALDAVRDLCAASGAHLIEESPRSGEHGGR